MITRSSYRAGRNYRRPVNPWGVAAIVVLCLSGAVSVAGLIALILWWIE